MVEENFSEDSESYRNRMREEIKIKTEEFLKSGKVIRSFDINETAIKNPTVCKYMVIERCL